MQHLHQVRIVRVLRNHDLVIRRAGVDLRDVFIRAEAGAAADEDLVGEPAQVLDQRELQHARPRPELAERERRDALIAVEEERELRQVEPAVGVAEQGDRHRVDARFAGFFACRERGQLAVVASRQVFADFDQLRRNQVEVVEEPLGGGRDEGAFADIFGEGAIRGLEDALVVAQPRINAAGVAPP